MTDEADRRLRFHENERIFSYQYSRRSSVIISLFSSFFTLLPSFLSFLSFFFLPSFMSTFMISISISTFMLMFFVFE